MKRRAKEIQSQQREARKYGRAPGYGGSGGFGSSSMGSRMDAAIIDTPVAVESHKPASKNPSYAELIFSYVTPSLFNSFSCFFLTQLSFVRRSMGSGMKLRPKEKNVDSFIDQLRTEGERTLTNYDLQSVQ